MTKAAGSIVLIGPCGIETRDRAVGIENQPVLIGPCGIETLNIRVSNILVHVLIGPCGIETNHPSGKVKPSRSINWTLRN